MKRLLTLIFALLLVTPCYGVDTPINARPATGSLADDDTFPVHDASENTGATRTILEFKNHITGGSVGTVTEADTVNSASTVENATTVTTATDISGTATTVESADNVSGTVTNATTVTQATTVTNSETTNYYDLDGSGITASAIELNQLDGVSVGGNASGDILTTNGTQDVHSKTYVNPLVSGPIDFNANSTPTILYGTGDRHFISIRGKDGVGPDVVAYSPDDSTHPGKARIITNNAGTPVVALDAEADGTVNLPVGLKIGGEATPYITHQYLQAQAVGTPLAIADVGGDVTLTALNHTDVVFFDNGNANLSLYRWDGSTFAQVGTPLSLPGRLNAAITALNDTDVAFVDNFQQNLVLYRWNGSTFAQVGSDLYVPGITRPTLTAINSTDVVFMDNYVNNLTLYRWNGSTFAQVGTPKSTSFSDPTLCAINSTDVVVYDSGTGRLILYRWDGLTFAQVGDDLATGNPGLSAMSAINSRDIVFSNSVNYQLTAYRWDGASFLQVGAPLAISGSGRTAIAAINGKDVVFIGAGISSLTTYRFAPNVLYSAAGGW